MPRPASDLVKVVWSGSGTTSPISLGSAVAGFIAFPAALDGLTVSYSIEHQTAAERETGFGVYTHSGTTLTREFVTASTNGGALVSFSAGTKHVRISPLAADFIENRVGADPTSADGRSQGYQAGRSTWFNTSTEKFWLCVNDDDGSPSTVVWQQIAFMADAAAVGHDHDVSDITGGADGQLMGWGTDDIGEAKDSSAYLNPDQGTNQEVIDGIETAVRSFSPAQLALAGTTHGGGAGSANETPDSATAITVGAAPGTHKTLTGTGAIALTLSQTAAQGVKQEFTPGTDQTITVTPAAQARYLVPGDTDAAATVAVSDAVWGTPTGNNVTITSAGNGLNDPSASPAAPFSAGNLFEIRTHSVAANNGYYIATGTPTAGSLPATKIDGTPPQAAGSEPVDLDALQRQAPFELTAYGWFECLENTGGNAAVWRFDGGSNLPSRNDGDLAVGGTLTAEGAATVGTTLGVTGAITATGGIDCNDPATFDDNITMDGSGKTASFGGNTVHSNIVSVVTGVSGVLTTAAHLGRTIVTSGNITVPTTTGFHCFVIFGGAHTVTFNGTVSAAAASGQVSSIMVQSATVIKMSTPATTATFT